MENIYAAWKPQQHRNLNENLKALDRLALFTFSGHLRLFDDLFNSESQGISPELRLALEQMLRVRTAYRSRAQRDDDPESVRDRLILLQKMQGINIPVKLLADFALTNESPNQIVNFILRQKPRGALALKTFHLLGELLAQDYCPLLTEILLFVLSKTRSFERMNRILQLSNLTNSETLGPVFKGFLSILRKRPMSTISLVCFRIFRDCPTLNLRTSFSNEAVELFCNVRPNDLSLFALCLSLVDALRDIPVVLKMDSASSPRISLLLSVALTTVPCDETFYMTFREVFWNPLPGTERILCRLLFHVLNSPLIGHHLVQDELEHLVESIGSKFHLFTDEALSAASEMIWILRWILVLKTRASERLIDILLNTPRDDPVKLCGLFAVLGATIENIRPYCNVKYHENRSTALDFIAVPTGRPYEFKCYPRPFNLRYPPRFIRLASNITVYAVPVVELTADSFDHFDFILSFFGSCTSAFTSVISSLYVQVLAHYLKFPAFVERFSPEMISVFAHFQLPFHSIYNTWSRLQKLHTIRSADECCGFGALAFESSPFISFLSPQLIPRSTVNVNVTFTGFEPPAYFGVVTDDVETRFTRFAVVEAATGVSFPYNLPMEENANPSEISFQVNLEARALIWRKHRVNLPLGDHFRIIIAVLRKVRVSIVTDDSTFAKDSCPVIARQAPPPISGRRLFQVPEALGSVGRFPRSLNDFPRWTPLITPLPAEQKLFASFIEPPSQIAIHVGIAAFASPGLIASHRKGLFGQLALQFATVCLMRIALVKTDLIPNPTHLFTLLMVPLEPFSVSSFTESRFPFSLTSPAWENWNYLCLGLEIEAKECLKRLISLPIYRTKLTEDLFEMCENKELHLIAFPHLSHSFFPARRYHPQFRIPNRFSIVTINSFTPIQTHVNLVTNRPERFPLIIANGPTQLAFPVDFANNDCSVFTISCDDNGFVFGTAFEAILLLKHLLFAAELPEERALLKSAFVDLCLAQSPLVLPYLADLADHISQQMPTSPYDTSPFYQQQLMLLGSLLQTGGFSPFLNLFFNQELRVFQNSSLAAICRCFPQWISGAPADSPPSTLDLFLPPIDAAANDYDPSGTLQSFRFFARQYRSLVGFPFWEALPYWLRVTGVRDSDPEPVPAAPVDGIVCVTNPGASHFLVFLSARFARDSVVMADSSASFLNSQPFTPASLAAGIPLPPRGSLFLSLIDVPGGWPAVSFRFVRHSRPPPTTVDISAIANEFAADMQIFALEWTPRDTEELVMALPRHVFASPAFASVAAAAANTTLCQRFSRAVVLLRALILHHFNYIRVRHANRVFPGVWDRLPGFVAWEDAADIIFRRITRTTVFATFAIDRRAAHALTSAGSGDPGRSIIAQLTAALRPLTLAQLQCGKRPWSITFQGEPAIDAGGPGRELMTEVAHSIFEPTSRLAIPVPNQREGIGACQDCFLPFDPIGIRLTDYATIGHFLGIVLRSGLAQEIPFAPLVWRFLAGEKLRKEDVFEVDDRLRESLKTVEQREATWSCDTWDGVLVTLPGHVPGVVVGPGEIDQFCQECIQFRLSTLRSALKSMRTTFRNNIGFKRQPVLHGALLSRMIQGFGTITVSELQALTVYKDYTGLEDPYIQRFWRTVGRMNQEQLKLLVRFVTTLTRIPNPGLHPEFKLEIDKLASKDPDAVLPTAATCYNRLHLPMYSEDEICDEKISYAIRFCQTMENK